MILTFDDDICGVLRKACDFDDEAMHLVHATQIVHKNFFNASPPFKFITIFN